MTPPIDLAGLIARLRRGASASHDMATHLVKYQALCNEAADALEAALAVTRPTLQTCEEAIRMFEGDELIALKLAVAISDLRDFRNGIIKEHKP